MDKKVIEALRLGEHLLLGIDVGTMLVKTLIFSPTGNVISSSSREISVEYPKVGWAEHDPEAIWNMTCLTIKEALERRNVAPGDIAGLSVTGQMQCSFLIDKEGKPARAKAIIWLDTRSKDILKRYYKERLADFIYDISGWRLTTSMPVVQLSWLKDNEPETLSRSRYLLACKDYIRFKLTGIPCTDLTDASATGLFNTKKKIWSEEVCDALRLRSDLLPDVKGSWEYAGEVTSDAAKVTGLKEGTPVATGAGDICSTALGAGVIRHGQVCAIIGTAGIYEMPINRPLYDPARMYSVACHAVPDQWLMSAVQMTAGATLRWFKNEMCYEESKQAHERGVSAYRIMDENAAKAQPGSNGVIFHPFFQGERSPFINSNARGLFFGLGLWTRKAEMVRAVLEGVAFAARDNIDLFRRKGLEVTEVRVTGGGAVSDVWCQIYADVLNTKISVPSVTECGTLGSAIEAGVVAGIFSNPIEGAEITFKEKRVYYPVKENVERYDRIFTVYKSLYKKIWKIYDLAADVYSSL